MPVRIKVVPRQFLSPLDDSRGAFLFRREPLEARHGVRRHGAVGVADMELGGRVVDGGCNVIITSAFFAHKESS